MATYYVMSDAVDDLMWESSSLRNAREGIRDMLALNSTDGDHKYFPLSIQVDDRKSPYRRKMRIVETWTLDGRVTTHLRTHPAYVRENGETVKVVGR